MRVFISYRRDDTAGWIPELRTSLQETSAGGDPIEPFIDVSDITYGGNWIRETRSRLEQSDAALVVIGRHWMGKLDDAPARLLEDDDPVRQELRHAIANAVPLVVVLLDGGVRPGVAELPADIRAAADAPLIEMRDFDSGIVELAAVLAGLGRRPGRTPAKATLRLVNSGTSWLGTDNRLHVRVDGKKIGTFVTGGNPAELLMPSGERSVKVGRGLFWSDPVIVSLRPGQVATLEYTGGALVSRVSLRLVPTE